MPFTKLIIDPPLIAHRGVSSLAPENTLAAFRQVKKVGLQWVELDVSLTADREVVVIHDDTLDRTTSGKGKMNEKDFSYIKTLDAGTWFDPIFNTEKVPTLIETLALFNELHLSLNIEIKAQPGLEEITVKSILAIIEHHWRQPSPILLSSFSKSILKWVRYYSRTQLLGLLQDEWNNEWEKICEKLDCHVVAFNYEKLNKERVKQVIDTGRTLLAYTVNDPSIARELFAWGVHAVFSDCPLEMINNFSN